MTKTRTCYNYNYDNVQGLKQSTIQDKALAAL